MPARPNPGKARMQRLDQGCSQRAVLEIAATTGGSSTVRRRRPEIVDGHKRGKIARDGLKTMRQRGFDVEGLKFGCGLLGVLKALFLSFGFVVFFLSSVFGGRPIARRVCLHRRFLSILGSLWFGRLVCLFFVLIGPDAGFVFGFFVGRHE